jgi:hypothetical protein
MSTWKEIFLNGDLPIRSENLNPNLDAIDALFDRDETKAIKEDLSFSTFTKEYCKPSPLFDCITFVETQS